MQKPRDAASLFFPPDQPDRPPPFFFFMTRTSFISAVPLPFNAPISPQSMKDDGGVEIYPSSHGF